jgi:hypothetical protein
MSVTVNDDVLRHICDLLPPEDLKNASTVHHVFLDRWIREKYRRVDFTRSDKPSKRLWERVRCVPFVFWFAWVLRTVSGFGCSVIINGLPMS